MIEVEIIEEADGCKEQCKEYDDYDEHDDECPEYYVRISKLVRLTGVSIDRLKRWIREGRIPCCREPGRHRLFPAREVAQAVEKLLRKFRLDGEDLRS